MREPETGRALLVAVELPTASPAAGPGQAAAGALDELAQLAVTAGLEPAEQVSQSRSAPDPAYYVGSGKVAELASLGERLGCSHLLFDDELSPVQARNLEQATDLEVLDRTQLILRIFAGRARSHEGKLQVELAQLTYELPRLTGRGTALSRLGGGLFTRGPGETKLEADRRVIRARISDLRRQITDLRRHRALHRAGRSRVPLPVASLVGYTNAGKSTLLNALTGATVVAEDKLFATLDPTTRALTVPGGLRVLLTDTVGFIRKLPHSLVAAFRATLEEVAAADLLLHVVDAAAPEAAAQAATVREVLVDAGAGEVPAITVLNKADAADPIELGRLARGFPDAVTVSARTGRGLERLAEAIAYNLRRWVEDLRILIPYHRADLLAALHDHGEVSHQDFGPAGVQVTASVYRGLAARIRQQLTSETPPCP